MTKMNEEERVRERLIAMTRDMMLIPGTEERPDDLHRAISWVRNHLEGIEGLEIVEYQRAGVLSLLARPAGIVEPEVLMCGHLDVVHHSDPEAYSSEVRDGRIVGPGSGDMKGIVAVLLELMRGIHQDRPGVSLALAVTTDEEIGGENGSGALFGEFGVRCGVAIVPDGGTIDEIVVEEKGILHVELVAHGTSCHAARPWLGNNAVDILARAVAAVQADFPIPDDAPDHWHATCAVTRFGTRNRSNNRVPSAAEATLDLRFPAPATTADILERVKVKLPPEVTTGKVTGAEPTLLSPDPWYLESCEQVLGRPPKLLREHGGSDARFISRLGIPVIMSRPLCGKLHSRDEWIDIDSMLTFHQIQRHYLERKLGLADG